MEATVQVRRLSSPEDREAVAPRLAELGTAGYTILRDLVDAPTLAAAKTELDRINAASRTGRNPFAGERTIRAYNLVAKSRAFDPLILHPSILALVEAHLGDDIQLSIATGITQLPAAAAQDYHRDDGVYTVPRPHAPFSVSVMWAIDAFTAENGATRLIPTSHLDGPADEGGRPELQAEMAAGSAVAWDGATLHGSGENRTDVARSGLAVIYNLAWLRQFENQYLAFTPETLRTLPPALPALLGYRVVHFTLGMLDGESPLRIVR